MLFTYKESLGFAYKKSDGIRAGYRHSLLIIVLLSLPDSVTIFLL